MTESNSKNLCVFFLLLSRTALNRAQRCTGQRQVTTFYVISVIFPFDNFKVQFYTDTSLLLDQQNLYTKFLWFSDVPDSVQSGKIAFAVALQIHPCSLIRIGWRWIKKTLLVNLVIKVPLRCRRAYHTILGKRRCYREEKKKC